MNFIWLTFAPKQQFQLSIWNNYQVEYRNIIEKDHCHVLLSTHHSICSVNSALQSFFASTWNKLWRICGIWNWCKRYTTSCIHKWFPRSWISRTRCRWNVMGFSIRRRHSHLFLHPHRPQCVRYIFFELCFWDIGYIFVCKCSFSV